VGIDQPGQLGRIDVVEHRAVGGQVVAGRLDADDAARSISSVAPPVVDSESLPAAQTAQFGA
jgi:hypothetical protein